MFIETGEGDLDAANLVCPANFEINLEDGSQTGQGRCTITGREGDQVFAEWNCKGEHLKGCKGDFKLIGGTGEFNGITGEGDFKIRSAISERRIDISTSSIHETALGIAIWEALHYKIP
jgi:hypothetical protein